MTTYMGSLPTYDFFNFAKRALKHFARGGSFIASRVAEMGESELAGPSYGRIDWDSENGEAIRDALIKIYNW